MQWRRWWNGKVARSGEDGGTTGVHGSVVVIVSDPK